MVLQTSSRIWWQITCISDFRDGQRVMWNPTFRDDHDHISSIAPPVSSLITSFRVPQLVIDHKAVNPAPKSQPCIIWDFCHHVKAPHRYSYHIFHIRVFHYECFFHSTEAELKKAIRINGVVQKMRHLLDIFFWFPYPIGSDPVLEGCRLVLTDTQQMRCGNGPSLRLLHSRSLFIGGGRTLWALVNSSYHPSYRWS